VFLRGGVWRVADLPSNGNLIVILLWRVLFPLEQFDTWLLCQVRCCQIMGCYVCERNVVAHWTSFKDRALRLVLFNQISTIVFLSEDAENSLPHWIALWCGVGIYWNLHPRRCEYRCFSVVISVSTSLKRLSAIHWSWGQSDPSLILWDNCDHSRLVNIGDFNLISGILHEPQILRYLPLVDGVLECILGENLVRPLEVLLLILWCLKHFLCHQLSHTLKVLCQR